MVRVEMTSKGGRQPGAGLAWWAGPKGMKGEEEKEGQMGSPGPNKNFGIFPIYRFRKREKGKGKRERKEGKV